MHQETTSNGQVVMKFVSNNPSYDSVVFYTVCTSVHLPYDLWSLFVSCYACLRFK